MSETTLYRKYRPHTFKDVVGQEHIVSVLQNELKQGTFSRAYLFSGTRGTGKTSLARIIASELGVSANDLYEIDAASNRGIDDIREIRESVRALPFDSKYKVYIIDEVHMLTKEAFNALLKTLEEPPEHVVFALATTEFEKLPDTIVSRCEVFQLKSPTQAVLKKLVADVAKKEGIKLEAASLELIALLGSGSFRDTIGVLQKAINASGSDGVITVEEVEKVLGAPRLETVHSFVEAVLKREADKGLEALQTANENNIDMKLFLNLVLARLRYVLLLRFGSAKLVEDEVSGDELDTLSAWAKDKELKLTAQTLVRFIDTHEQLSVASVPSLPLELALLDIVDN